MAKRKRTNELFQSYQTLEYFTIKTKTV